MRALAGMTALCSTGSHGLQQVSTGLFTWQLGRVLGYQVEEFKPSCILWSERVSHQFCPILLVKARTRPTQIQMVGKPPYLDRRRRKSHCPKGGHTEGYNCGHFCKHSTRETLFDLFTAIPEAPGTAPSPKVLHNESSAHHFWTRGCPICSLIATANF